MDVRFHMSGMGFFFVIPTGGYRGSIGKPRPMIFDQPCRERLWRNNSAGQIHEDQYNSLPFMPAGKHVMWFFRGMPTDKPDGEWKILYGS